jgi:hypothetical protein
MATAWTLTRERLADKALEHCGVLGVGKVPSYEDRGLALETLDGILKELPIYGYTWPKIIATQASLTLTAATSPTLLPTDYYGSLMPELVAADGTEWPLRLITMAEWNTIADKDYAAEYPDRAYIDASRKLWTWPVQTANRVLKIFYQKVVDDTVASSAADISVPFLMGLSYGIAANIGDAFGVPEKKIMRFEAKWAVARGRGMNADVPLAPIRFEVLE